MFLTARPYYSARGPHCRCLCKVYLKQVLTGVIFAPVLPEPTAAAAEVAEQRENDDGSGGGLVGLREQVKGRAASSVKPKKKRRKV